MALGSEQLEGNAQESGRGLSQFGWQQPGDLAPPHCE